MRASRAAIITSALMAGGAIAGALAGAVAGLLILLVWRPPTALPFQAYFVALHALVGAALSSVLAPLTAWTALRAVPFWRLYAETALGMAIGAVVGLEWLWPVFLLLGAPNVAEVFPLLGAALGFLAAVAHLRVVASRSVVHAAAPSNPAG